MQVDIDLEWDRWHFGLWQETRSCEYDQSVEGLKPFIARYILFKHQPGRSRHGLAAFWALHALGAVGCYGG